MHKGVLEKWRFSSFATAVMSIILYNLHLIMASLYTGVLPSIALGIRTSLEALIAGYFADLDLDFRARYPDALARLYKALNTLEVLENFVPNVCINVLMVVF